MGEMVHVETPDLEVSFTCVVNSGDGSAVDILWSGPVSLPEPTTTEIDTGIFRSNLTLTNVTTAFTGLYLCVARYNNSLCHGNISSNVSLIIVLRPPAIVGQTESPFKVDSGASVNLYFEFSSRPSLTDVWCSGPDGAINTSALGVTLVRTNNDAEFRIRLDVNIASVQYTHGGLYLCTANNSVGNITATTLLLIRPVVQPRGVLTRNGSNAILICLAQSFPEPSYVWEKLQDGGDNDIIPDVFGFASGSGENMMAIQPFLKFEPVHYGDAGVYRCVVNINRTWMVSSDSVTVVGKLK